ncbi:AroM family protein [Occultella glacieicola]|uniref:AroM family protein n=1 Tax=Occultella glacieicola TaxID=2518684 RepID=A0ABY2E3E7_9MICO|nr:AroM family protein [Occultella glacieicola]TDE94149.1 AroM family protein [Occultella glacieicola]
MTTLALITIGQAPRTDVTGEVLPLLPADVVREYGALDGLDAAQIADLAPRPGESALTSRLRDGGSAVFAHAAAVPLLQAAVTRAEADGADLTLLMCGGLFPALEHERPLFGVERLAHDGVRGLLSGFGPGARLGVVRPLPEQVDEAYDHWQTSIGVRPTAATAASPYTDPVRTIAAATATLAPHSDLIVLDCMGFDETMRAAATSAVGPDVAVVTIRSVAARLLGAVL